MATASKPAAPVLYREIRDELQTYKDEITASLPKDIEASRFIRAAAHSVQASPQLQQCSKKSLVAACLKAALDGLLPDGREGAIVPYQADTGDGRRALTAQWIPMIQGIRKKIYASGKVKHWECQVVQEGDLFDYELGDRPFIKHKPALRGGRTRRIIAVYSIATFPDGSQSFEIMNGDQIEDVRRKSKAKHGPWSDPVFYPEMARKTVAKLHSKQLPTNADVENLFRREDESLGALDVGGSAQHQPASENPRPSTRSTRESLSRFAPQVAPPEEEPPIIDEEAAPDFPGDVPPDPPLKPGEVETATGREQPLQREPPAPKKPQNAEEYRTYYEARRSAASHDLSQAQMLRGWFHGDAERRLRSKCQVPIEEINDMKQDLEDHLRALESAQHD